MCSFDKQQHPVQTRRTDSDHLSWLAKVGGSRLDNFIDGLNVEIVPNVLSFLAQALLSLSSAGPEVSHLSAPNILHFTFYILNPRDKNVRNVVCLHLSVWELLVKYGENILAYTSYLLVSAPNPYFYIY